ncbi:polysaccharide pyruvyl transferase family protein [Teichococcus deserti]|uniref:polysaccharide pyruvyl transferase family protein n=1 Tax=Teichococcus deserti TaxID=1817963 RepID=UPI0010553AD6|nr:polysaccharide pyruvyl transferase family protein [Pseudoroseomonas deserti]
MYSRLLMTPLAPDYEPLFAEQAPAAEAAGSFAPHAQLIQAIAHAEAGLPVLLHVHWEEFFLKVASDAAEADEAALLAIQQMEKLRRLGGRLIWTVHNAAPHRMPHRQAFMTLRRWLAAQADAILVHSQHAVEFLSAQVTVDRARIQVLPHPSYLGHYEPEAAAAAGLGTAPSRVVLGFGRVQPQKGFDRLVGMLPAAYLAAQQAMLRISGEGGRGARALRRSLPERTDVQWDFRHVPDAEVPGLIRDAACVVLAYEQFLTSGVAMLVLSCGGILVAPDVPQLRELLPEALHRFLYQDGDAVDLQMVVSGVLALSEADRLACRRLGLEVARRLRPAVVAAELAAVYDRLSAGPPPRPVCALPAGLQRVAPSPEDGQDALTPVIADWPRQDAVGQNWGDKLNPPLIRLLSERPVLHVDHGGSEPPRDVIRVIGSGIRSSRDSYVIWGSGFIGSKDKVPALRRIHAVRGPLTRAKLIAAGQDCPAVYGDPALLMPIFYRPAIAVEYDLGIIQHFREAGVEPLPRIAPGLRVRIIDITGGITAVLDDILACREIVSSSLHGLIAAHAYGVPATWIKFSDRPLGDGFKFRDYWASVGWPAAQAIFVNGETDALSLMGEKRQAIPIIDVQALLEACPFVHAERRAALRARAAETLPVIPPVQFLAAA